ncbi:MAG: hypothetical protein KF869_04460 [Phycisphaeraceae bacterium]|nr:hypothetical protein [Phycisphaeraceae bacterium]
MITRMFWLLAATVALGPFMCRAVAATPAAPIDDDTTRWIGRMPLAEATPAAAEQGEVFALQRYVAFDDGAFAWSKEGEQPVDGGTVHHLRLTSQRWRSAGEVNRPHWRHWVTVAVPERVTRRTAILVIGGGRHADAPPARAPRELMLLLRAAGAVVIYIDNVPNQPLQLEGDGRDRWEDGLVARSWRLAMRDDDASWIVRFPMVKSAARAMDAAEAYLGELAGRTGRDELVPTGFFAVGASKRGWTAWLLAAVDARVKGIAPLVIDMLNIPEHTAHHWASYGFWAPALRDYNENEISRFFGSPQLRRITAHEDPAEYLTRVEHLPRLIVTAAGDEFFPADSFRHYESRLKGEWRLRTAPNASHGLSGTLVPMETLAFYHAIDSGTPLPRIEWTHKAEDQGDVLEVRATQRPTAVTLWQCDNPTARDFRLETTGREWQPTALEPIDTEGREWTVRMDRPEKGWRAYLVECAFAGPTGLPLVFTTRVYITPDTLPFADKRME